MVDLQSLRRISINRKLTLIMMVSSTVAVLLVSGAFVGYEWFTFRKRMQTELSSLAQFIATQNDVALSYGISADAYDSLGALSVKPNIVSACLYTTNGQVFATYPADLPRSRIPKKADKDGSWFEHDRLKLSQKIVMKNGDVIGALYIES